MLSVRLWRAAPYKCRQINGWHLYNSWYISLTLTGFEWNEKCERVGKTSTALSSHLVKRICNRKHEP